MHLRFLQQNPLVPAAALFILGLTVGGYTHFHAVTLLLIAAITLVLYGVSESLRLPHLATTALVLSLTTTGTLTWQLNQHYVEPLHIARFASDSELALTARIRVLTPPADSSYGNLFFTAQTTEIFTDHGWIPSTGDLQVKWRAGSSNSLHRGDLLQIYGWLAKPPPAINPGALDMRQHLAADRIFAQVRVPRAFGIQLLDPSSSPGDSPLTRFRTFLRGKLLEHTARQDFTAASTMVALLLGYRDPSIDDVSQSFADAGIAHLLAISGSHLVFFAAFVWSILRFLPIRPRLREILVMLIVIAYVAATPCGPPVIRATIVLGMAILTRFLARPRMALNMLAAAAIIVLIVRPADLLSPGFQLTFVCTASLVLLAQRLHTLLFATRLEHMEQLANLTDSAAARFRYRVVKVLSALVIANTIGAVSSLPLVIYHFGQANLYAFVAGLVALPFVALTMIASLIQLLLSLASTTLAATFAPLSTCAASAMLWIIHILASLPGAVIPLRPPPGWTILLIYAALIAAIFRQPLRLSRAASVNLIACSLLILAAWFTLTMPLGKLELQVLSVGQGNCILARTPRGDLYLFNAGSRDLAGIAQTTVRPALRMQGARRLDAIVLTNLDTPHASVAPQVLQAFMPHSLLVSESQWGHSGWTFAGESLTEVVADKGVTFVPLRSGECFDLGYSARLEVVYAGDPESGAGGSILLIEYAGKRILLVDPADLAPLNLVQISDNPITADAVILLGQPRSSSADALEKILSTTRSIPPHPAGTPTTLTLSNAGTLTENGPYPP